MTITFCALFAILVFLAIGLVARETAGTSLPMPWGWHGLSVLLIAIVLLTPAMWYDASTYLGDLWLTVEAVHKTHQGLLSSRDYFSPIGPAMAWIYRLTFLVHPPSVRSILLGNAAVATLTLSLAILLLRKRATPLSVAIAGLIAVTTALSPRDIDLPGLQSSFLAPYNRWSWALLVPVVLRAALPLAGADAIGAWLMGPAIALLLLLKVTYAAAAIAVLGLAVALQPRHWRELSIAAIGTGATLVIADLLTGGGVRAYLADLHQASTMSSNGLRLDKLLAELPSFLLFATGSLLVLIAATRGDEGTPLDALRNHWRASLLLLATGGVGLIVLMQNFYNNEATTLLLMPLIVGEWTGLFAGLRAPKSLWRRGGELVALVLVATLSRPALDAGVILAQPIELLRKQPTPTLAGSEFRDLAIEFTHLPDAAGHCADGTCEDYRRMLSGRDLLRRFCRPRPGHTVLAANFSNPFPALLGEPSPAASPAWFHANRSFSRAVHVPYARLVADVDCILEARGESNSALFMAIYGAQVGQDYRAIAQDDHWILWRRAIVDQGPKVSDPRFPAGRPSG